MDTVQGIDNDLNAFIQIFKNFVDKYKPQDPKSGRVLNLPPEVQYFLKIWDKKAVEIPDEHCASIEQLSGFDVCHELSAGPTTYTCV
ncbi:hypothetical protein CCACVL1_09762 [Corchorus capsularis]|uniref:Uncharacterized protein n=1 Tax=Corchorus capsularis TaxID=210143 RepID=A0A1R3IUA0_COCAP|nr:hypothetical protein CCACVL1_09762 [Corchorus capsularis]